MTKRSLFRILAAAAAALCGLLLLSVSLADPVKLPANYKNALKTVRAEQPAEAVLENVRFSPEQLAAIRDAMPEGGVLHFSTTWKKVRFSDDSETVDLTNIDGYATKSDLEHIISLCPNLRVLDNSTRMRPSNDVMIPLMEQYPDIHFEWMVHLKGEHYCRTNATAYSTMNHTDGGTRLNSDDLQLLRYIPGLRALDIGHNSFTDFSFLKYCPDLELLIISNNSHVEDISALSQLRHLQYLEVHNTNVSDLTPLSACRELIDLNISSTKVADLSPLDGIDTLDRLWANAVKKLPQSEKDRFVSLHPNCTADFKGTSAVSHRWREHPRYYHFRRCFKHKMWVPFNEPWPEN